MKCPKCNNYEFSYLNRLFMAFFGAVHCKKCSSLINLNQKNDIISIAIGVLLLITSFILLDRISFFLILILAGFAFNFYTAWRSTLKENKNRSKLLRVALLSFRYTILMPAIFTISLGIPIALIFYFNSPPIVKKDVNLDLLEFSKIEKDTSVDAMDVIVKLPKFASTDSAIICSSYNNHYFINDKLEKIIDEYYPKIIPLLNCTYIDTSKLSADTSFLYKGDKRYDKLMALTPYLKLLLVQINNNLEKNNFNKVIENITLGLHINTLIAESEIGLVSTMVSTFYTKKIFDVLLSKEKQFYRNSDINRIENILESFSFNYDVYLNSLRNEYEIQKRGLSFTLNEIEKVTILNATYKRKISKKYYDFNECVDIQKHVWARRILEANLPFYSKDTIENYEINQLTKYANDPYFYRLIFYPNTYGRILASVASPDYSAGRYKIVNMKRKKAFLQNVLIIKDYKIKFNKFPNIEEFVKLKPPIDPATNLPFLYDPIKKEISAEFDSKLSDSLVIKF